jgi:hypothetical protein
MSQYDSSGNLAPDRRSKYRRPRHAFSTWGILIGLVLGIAGGLVYAWIINPRIEFNTEPWQLDKQGRAQYIAAVTLSYSYDGDLNRAISRLLALKLQTDPIQEVANVACDLATTGYADTGTGLRAIQSMMVFYQLQGRKGCADNLISVSEPTVVVNVDVATPTQQPPATKTPTPERASPATATQPIFVPTVQPKTNYVIAAIRDDCDAQASGVIEVRVQDFNGDGVPGQAVRVRWDSGSSTFYTGLKPERGPDYADFQMEAGKAYTVEMPGQSDPSQPLGAVPCTTADGKQAITLYRVYFRPGG